MVAVGCNSRGSRAGASVEDVGEGCIGCIGEGCTGCTGEGCTGYISEGCRRIRDWGVASIALASFSVPCGEAYIAILALTLGRRLRLAIIKTKVIV